MNTPTPVPPAPVAPPLTGFAALWANHGTKILGGITTGLATIAAFTPNDFAMWGINGHTALRITVIASGLLTIFRGFTNTAAKS